MAALETEGVDFFWIDWQQGGQQGGCEGGAMNPRIALNHLRTTAHDRRQEDRRGFVLARQETCSQCHDNIFYYYFL
eukprot:959175-Pyramimonas_sp.AAC.1